MLRQIKASAGSGKTYRLTSEFLDRLLHATQKRISACISGPATPNYCWPEILAVTFTNKAATEMQERIIRTLKERALGKGVNGPAADWKPATARYWVRTLLRHYSALNVRTIDSLLHMLIRLCALELGLPPDFTPVFEKEKELFAPLYEKLLEEARNAPWLQEQLAQVVQATLNLPKSGGFMVGERVRKELFALMEHALLSSVPAMPVVDIAAITKSRKAHRKTAQQNAHTLLKGFEAEGLAVRRYYKDLLQKVIVLQPMEELPVSRMGEKKKLDDCLNKTSKGKASAALHDAHEAFTKEYNWSHSTGALLRSALHLAPFTVLAGQLMEKMQTILKQDGLVPNDLFPAYVCAALSGEFGPSEVFCRMGNRLSHILVDEFQDTSSAQWQAMLPLAIEGMSKGGSVTCVGDLKQAIYSWRGGDSALFDSLQDTPELHAICPTPELLSLPFNWRSSKIVVTTNNRIFGVLAHAQTADAVAENICKKDTPYSIVQETSARIQRTFAGAEQSIPEYKESSGGIVRLYNITAETKEAISCSVQMALYELLLDDIIKRRKWRDVAILVRSNNEATQVAKWLVSKNIPIITENSLCLADHPIITQLLAFLRFLDYPLDDLALCEVLMGREVFGHISGLTLETLHDWLTSRRTGPILASFRETFPQEWHRWFAPFYTQAGLMSAYDTVQELCNHFTIEHRYPAERIFIRRFLEIVHAADVKGMRSISTFLEYWRQSGSTEKVPMADTLDAVRILTMHKAKGLEFPVVILPFQNHELKKDSKPVRTTVDGIDIMVRNSSKLGDKWYQDYARKACEQLNLLYVAWTRAVDELYAFVCHSEKRPTVSPMQEALRIVLGQNYPPPNAYTQWGDTPARGYAMPVPHAKQHAPLPPPEVERSPSEDATLPDWSPMSWLPTLKIFRNPLENILFTERHRGELAHACMAALRLTGNVEADIQRAIHQGLHTYSHVISPEKAKKILMTELYDMLSWATKLPQMSAWLAQGTPEQSIMGNDGTLHRVDLYVDDGQATTVIEYKTGAPSKAHHKQVVRYLELLERISPNPVHGMLVYLDQRQVVPLDTKGLLV